MSFTRHFPMIKTVYDADAPHSLIYSSSIQNVLMRLLPPQFFLNEQQWEKPFEKELPLFKWNVWDSSSQHISLFLVHVHRPNAVKFFYEMISRWLLPSRRIPISCFFALDFQMPELSKQMYTFCEIAISLESEKEREFVLQRLPIIASEIELGLVSVYHANRILEIKGLSVDEKTSAIQERIVSLIKRSPKNFDYDIFSEMQHFLIMCTEEFKSERTSLYMTRIISVFYLFNKTLRDQMEKQGEQRFVLVKLCKTELHLPFGMKRVLSVHVGLNFLSDNEIFEERHMITALRAVCPDAQVIEGSYFARLFKEAKIHMLYLEIEKTDGSDFSREQIQALRVQLQGAMRSGVEKLKRPVFMPRNEEEVMRGIITLSKQLRYSKDLPQVIISFDEQSESGLSFTIILVRIRNGMQPPIQELFEQVQTPLKFVPDRVKQLGLFRKKYIKEATVFRLTIAAEDFVRPDHSIDLFKARQEILNALQQFIGEVRDYNGGMIAKQHEQFTALKSLFPTLDKAKELLLENVFHSIFPIELRSVLEPSLIKIFFTLFLEFVEEKKEGYLQRQQQDALFWVFSHRDPQVRKNILNAVEKMHLPSSQLITISLSLSEMLYFGYIFRDRDSEARKKFLKRISSIIL